MKRLTLTIPDEIEAGCLAMARRLNIPPAAFWEHHAVGVAAYGHFRQAGEDRDLTFPEYDYPTLRAAQAVARKLGREVPRNLARASNLTAKEKAQRLKHWTVQLSYLDRAGKSWTAEFDRHGKDVTERVNADAEAQRQKEATKGTISIELPIAVVMQARRDAEAKRLPVGDYIVGLIHGALVAAGLFDEQ